MANVEGELYFSPNHTFEKIKRFLKQNNREGLIEAFKDRVYGFYLGPARELNEIAKKALEDRDKKFGFSFSVGLICVATIDFIALFSTRVEDSKFRFVIWLIDNIDEFKDNPKLAVDFYNWYRNGLVHEGRIKEAGQFSYECNRLISVENGIIKINPDKLLEEIERAIEKYIETLRQNNEEFEHFKERLDKKFRKEFGYIKRR